MTNVLTRIKINKIISTATVTGISLILFASIFSAIPTSSASLVISICEENFEGSVIFDSNSVNDSDTGDFIQVFKCIIPNVDCIDNDPFPNSIEEVPKNFPISSTCLGFGVVMITNVGAVLTDSVPAEWEVIGFSSDIGICNSVEKGNGKGATVIKCEPNAGLTAFSVEFLETRESPGSGKGNQSNDRFKPTSCEQLFKNDGAEGSLPDATFTNGFLNDDEIIDTVTPFSTGLTDKIEVTVAGCNG